MTEDAKQKRREYYKKWREKNREKVKEYNVRYWSKKAATEQEGKKDERNK